VERFNGKPAADPRLSIPCSAARSDFRKDRDMPVMLTQI